MRLLEIVGILLLAGGLVLGIFFGDVRHGNWAAYTALGMIPVGVIMLVLSRR